jgi:hypothetical protein
MHFDVKKNRQDEHYGVIATMLLYVFALSHNASTLLFIVSRLMEIVIAFYSYRSALVETFWFYMVIALRT